MISEIVIDPLKIFMLQSWGFKPIIGKNFTVKWDGLAIRVNSAADYLRLVQSGPFRSIRVNLGTKNFKGSSVARARSMILDLKIKLEARPAFGSHFGLGIPLTKRLLGLRFNHKVRIQPVLGK